MPGMKLLSRPVVADGFWQPAPLDPPLDWFTDEAADAAPPKLTIYPDGAVAGVVAAAGVCTLNEVTPGECWTVPRPRDGRGSTLMCALDSGELVEEYRKAHVGSTVCIDRDGQRVEIVTANLAGAGGHASPTGTIRAAQVHYNDASDDTRYMVARGRYVWSDQAGGVVFVGAAWPEVNERRAAEVRSAACSIDYRLIRGQGIDDYRLVGSCLVNIGAIPSRFAALLEYGPVTVTVEAVERLYADAPESRAAALAAFGFEEDDMPQVARTHHDPIPSGVPTFAASSYSNGVNGLIGTPLAPVIQTTGDCACKGTSNPAVVTAAYVLVNDGGADFGRQVTWSGGVGMYVDSLAMADGSPAYVVFPEVNGSLDDDNPVVVAAADATVTDARYEYVYADELIEDLVITAATSLPVRLLAGRGGDARVETPESVLAALGPVIGYVEERERAEVAEALAELAPVTVDPAAV